MASSIEELLDILYDMVNNARHMPLSSDKYIIDRDKILDILDEVKVDFPVEFKKARDIVSSKNDYIASAKREADDIRKQADEHAKRILNEDMLVLQVKQQAEEILTQAEERARQLTRAANEYCEEALRRMEEAVAEAHETAKQTRAQFRAAMSSTPGGNRLPYDAEADEE